MSETDHRPSRTAVIARALTNPSVRRVLVAYLLFNLAEWANWIALLVWAYDRDGVRGSGAVALVQLVPAMLLAPAVAGWAARLPRRRALTVGYAAQALAYLAAGTALVLDAPYLVVAVLAALASVTVTVTRPVHNAVLPALARTTDELTAANTASGTVEAVATFGGPLLSALIILPWGTAGVLLTSGVAMALAAVITVGVRVGEGADERVLAGSREGGLMREVLRSRTARTLTAMVAAEYVLVGMMDILLVVLALDVLGTQASGPGLLNSALGLGSVLGAALTVILVGRQRITPPLVTAAVLTGTAIALTGQVPGAVLAAVLLAVAGAGKLFVDVASRTLVQRVLPERMLVAVFGVQEATMMGGLALGALLAPILVHLAGPRWAFLLAGLFLPVVTLACWWGLRDADARAQVPAETYAVLAGVPFLALLAPRTVERLARGARTTKAAAGSTLVREGEPGQVFFALLAGRVAVSQGGTHLRELGQGASFGEIALLRDVPRTATVTALTDVRLVEVDREPFLTAVTGTPSAATAADEHASRYRAEDPT